MKFDVEAYIAALPSHANLALIGRGVGYWSPQNSKFCKLAHTAYSSAACPISSGGRAAYLSRHCATIY